MKTEYPKLQGETFLVFGEDFSRHPHALEHILRPLFGLNDFIWVETIGLRAPRISRYDAIRIYEKLRNMLLKRSSLNTQETLPDRFTLLAPFMLPFNHFKCVRKFNEWSVKRTVRNVLKSTIKPILITSVPNACDYIGHFYESKKIYFCVDEFSLWPGLNFTLVSEMEQKLLALVDRVIATSDILASSKVIPGFQTPVITHGVDFDFFHIPLLPQKNKVPKLCYFGLFDERFDQRLILELLELKKDIEIHIFGNAVCSHTDLSNYSNVFFHGKIDYFQLPQAISDMDIFILPYVRSSLTQNINPLKLKEYMATGRPVIATRLPEVEKLGKYLFLADAPADFLGIIDQYQTGQLDHNQAEVIQYVSSNETWKSKCEQLCKIIIAMKNDNF